MTGLLTRVLDERADATTPHVDLDAVLADGRRRVRRGRLATGVAVTAIAGVVAGGALVLPRPSTPPSPQRDLAASPGAAFTERRSSYATGDVIHWGEESFSVGRPVSSYVQTDDGFVFTTKNGDVWLHDGSSAERVGHAEANRLRADDSGSLVTWVDRAEDGAFQYVFFDTAERREVIRLADDGAGASRAEGDAEVFALDDGVAYVRYGGDMVSYDIASGEETVLDTWSPPADPAEKSEPVGVAVVDAAAGNLAYYVDAGAEWGLRVGEDLDTSTRARTLARASDGVLSPGARYLGTEEDDGIAVYDVASGANVTPDLTGYPFAVPYGWADDDTALVFALEQLAPRQGRYVGDLLECDIPTGACATVTEVRVDPASFTLPVGDAMDT